MVVEVGEECDCHVRLTCFVDSPVTMGIGGRSFLFWYFCYDLDLIIKMVSSNIINCFYPQSIRVRREGTYKVMLIFLCFLDFY